MRQYDSNTMLFRLSDGKHKTSLPAQCVGWHVCMCTSVLAARTSTVNLMDDVIFAKASRCFSSVSRFRQNRSKSNTVYMCVKRAPPALNIFISSNIDRIASESFVKSIVESFVHFIYLFCVPFCLCVHIDWLTFIKLTLILFGSASRWRRFFSLNFAFIWKRI